MRTLASLLATALLAAGCDFYWSGEDDGPDARPRPGADAGEAADARKPRPDAGPRPDASPGPKRIFVTAAAYTADLTGFGNGNGLAGADALCEAAADSVLAGGRWKAWLSTAQVDAVDRMADTGPWIRIGDEEVVFNNKANLVTLPLASVAQTERGDYLNWNDDRVWTGTLVGGVGSISHCEGWSSASAWATIGSALSAESAWTAGSNLGCGSAAHLYCFEQ